MSFIDETKENIAKAKKHEDALAAEKKKSEIFNRGYSEGRADAMADREYNRDGFEKSDGDHNPDSQYYWRGYYEGYRSIKPDHSPGVHCIRI